MGHELAEQLCDVQDAVRINLEMISDQMTQSDLGSRYGDNILIFTDKN